MLLKPITDFALSHESVIFLSIKNYLLKCITFLICTRNGDIDEILYIMITL